MRRAPSAALISLAEAIEMLTGRVAPVPPISRPTRDALGAITAFDTLAHDTVPDRDIAVRDGWAVALADVAGASRHAPVGLGELPAWLDAGEPMPDGTDTILPRHSIESVSEPEIAADAPLGDGTAPAGAHLRAGEVIVAAGARVTALQTIALALCGTGQIQVRTPLVRLVVTGGARLVREALGPALAALVGAAGGRISEAVHVADEASVIADAINAGDADGVLVLGGTGYGRNDHSAAALAGTGRLLAHGIALRPGETAGFGQANGRPVLLLPGRPDATLAAFLALGRPLLRALAGASETPHVIAPILRKVPSTIGLSEVVFVRRAPDGLEPLGAAEIPLRQLLRAEGAILVPPDQEGYPEGTMVEMIPL